MKDLAEEYLDKVCFERAYLKKLSIPIMSHDKVFDRIDIKAAFNAGRESVVENIPKLKWEDCPGGYEARTSFLCYRIYVNELRKKKYTLKYPNSVLKECLRLASAKQLASEDNKERLKEAFGI